MTTTDLLKPILDGGIRSVNFFNGRLLTGEDLSDEQRASRDDRRRLGQAIGDGIAYGLDVQVPPTSSASQPIVTVEPGLAVNRLGQSLRLAAPVDLSLVRPPETATAGGAAGFAECAPTQPSVFVAAGQGVYLLVLSAVERSEGRAPTSGLGNVEAACSTRYTVAGVQFRLIQLTAASADLADPPRLRNRVAVRCFGLEQLQAFANNPFGPALDRYGLLDDLRPNTLTDCDVPLAVLHWTGTGVQYVDPWAVRRHLVDPPVAGRWQLVAGERRLAEAEAFWLQAQHQLASTPSSQRPQLAAATRFRFLPPAGVLNVASGNFHWPTFLGPLAPPAETVVDGGLLRTILLRSLTMDAIPLEQQPAVNVEVFRSHAQPDVVVWSRTVQGRVRVRLSPTPPANASIRVYVTGYHGTRLRNERGPVDRVDVADVPAGTSKVRVLVAGFHRRRVNDVGVRGGQITELALTLDPLATATIRLLVRDAATGATLGRAGSGVTATASSGLVVRAATTDASGAFVFANLAPGTYSLAISSVNYEPIAPLSVAVNAGQTAERSLLLTPKVEDERTPPLCITVGTRSAIVAAKTRLCMVPESFAPTSPAQLKLTEAGSIPEEVLRWLSLWRDWFSAQHPDAGLSDAEPTVGIAPSIVSRTPRIFAVFATHVRTLPALAELLVNPSDKRTKIGVGLRKAKLPGVDDETIGLLERYGIASIDQLAGASVELVARATGKSTEYSRSLVEDAARAVDEINSKRTYYEGVDERVAGVLDQLSLTDDVALANADPAILAEQLGSTGFATRLIEQARSVVPREAWALDQLGLAPDKVATLEAEGIRSKGQFSRRAASDAGRDALAADLGADAQFVAGLRATAKAQLTTSSVTLAPDRALTSLAGVNAIVADKLRAANIASIEALAAARPADVARAAELSEAAASTIIAAAAASARTTLDVAKLASVSNDAAASLKALGVATVADLAGKDADEIQGAFGGDLRLASAVIEGAKLALGRLGR